MFYVAFIDKHVVLYQFIRKVCGNASQANVARLYESRVKEQLVLSDDFAKEFMGRRQSPKKISDKTTFPYNPRTDLKINSTTA